MRVSRLSRAAWIVAASLYAMTAPVSATYMSWHYTGTVNGVYSYSGDPLPADLVVGAHVVGTISFDTAHAGMPTSEFTSCFPCGSGVTNYFPFLAGLSQSVTIGSHTWSENLGEVALSQGQFFGINTQMVTVSSAHSGALLGVSFAESLPNPNPNTIFPDINVLDGIDLLNATYRSGSVMTGGIGDYYVNYAIHPFSASIPEPASMSIILAGLVGLAATRRSRRNAA